MTRAELRAMPFAGVNGQTIHYQDTHPESGPEAPAIVLSHGFAMDHEMWVHQVEPLADAGWRVIAYDERGWGQTIHDGPFDYWDLAKDVLALMDHLHLDSAVLGGMSQGGFLSLRAALTAPKRVRALVLVDSEAGTYTDEEAAGYQALFDAAMEMGMVGDLGEAMRAALFGPEFADARYWRGKWVARPVTRWLDAKECLFGRDDITDRIGEIACPAITFHGDVDMAIPLDDGRALAEGLSGPSEFVVIPNAGHSANLEKPELLNPPMLAFLESLPEPA